MPPSTVRPPVHQCTSLELIVPADADLTQPIRSFRVKTAGNVVARGLTDNVDVDLGAFQAGEVFDMCALIRIASTTSAGIVAGR